MNHPRVRTKRLSSAEGDCKQDNSRSPTYLWAQSLLWGLVCLEVPCSPASLRGPLFQLVQAYLEALGKRTSPVSNTESPWKWECIKDGAVIEVRQAASS